MKALLYLISYMSCITLSAQSNPEDVIHNFFQAMSDIDTVYLDAVMDDDMVLSSTMFSNDTYDVRHGDKRKFIASIAQTVKGDLDEQISNLQVNRDGALANVWMDYTFYYQGKLSHCGVNNFTLGRDGDRWKILSLVDSRRKIDCVFHNERSMINDLLDNWHLGATNADSTSYFDLMTTNSVYVGTDKSEVWSKREFLKFASPYFAKGKAWAFTKVERNIYSQDFEKIAWFDEVLDTWMGPCRGSGVVVKNDEGKWKVQHYVLSVAVNNEDIKGYLEIIKKEKK